MHQFVSGPDGSQKTALDILELESQLFVSHHVGGGTQTQVRSRGTVANSLKC